MADRNGAQKHVIRARIVLHSADRPTVADVARRAGVGRPAVWRWQRRFVEAGVDGLLHDATRKPGKPPLGAPTMKRVVALTCAEPPGEATHWTGRAMAGQPGSACARSSASGPTTGSSRTGRDASSCRPIRRSPPSCATWSASTSIRRRTAWCSRSTRSPMCGWPPARKRKVSVWRNQVALRSCVRPVDRPGGTLGLPQVSGRRRRPLATRLLPDHRPTVARAGRADFMRATGSGKPGKKSVSAPTGRSRRRPCGRPR